MGYSCLPLKATDHICVQLPGAVAVLHAGPVEVSLEVLHQPHWPGVPPEDQPAVGAHPQGTQRGQCCRHYHLHVSVLSFPISVPVCLSLNICFLDS